MRSSIAGSILLHLITVTYKGIVTKLRQRFRAAVLALLLHLGKTEKLDERSLCVHSPMKMHKKLLAGCRNHYEKTSTILLHATVAAAKTWGEMFAVRTFFCSTYLTLANYERNDRM